MEAIIDYECAHLTKPDASRNAWDTISSGHTIANLDIVPMMLDICRILGIDDSTDARLRYPDYVGEFDSIEEIFATGFEVAEAFKRTHPFFGDYLEEVHGLETDL